MAFGTEDSIFKIEHYKTEGKGLAFKREIASVNDIIVVETPIIAYKHKFSKLTTLSCDYCFKCVGSLNDYINYLCKLNPKLQICAIKDKFFENKLSDFIECSNGCGSIYCSALCYQKSIDNGHYVLCKMDSLSKQYWSEFERYSMSISETFIFAGLIIIQILYNVNQGYELQDQMSHYLDFYSVPWHEIKRVDSFNAKECIDIALTLLIKSLSEYNKTNGIDGGKILSFDFYSKIMGMIELVAIDIEVESAHNGLIFRNVNNFAKNIWKQLLAVKELIDGLDQSTLLNCDIQQFIENFGPDIVPDVLGLGIFSTFSRMNHSCAPNIEINYYNNFMAHGKLLTKVRGNDQAYISYIDENLPKKRRNELLSRYQFQCGCDKCTCED